MGKWFSLLEWTVLEIAASDISAFQISNAETSDAAISNESNYLFNLIRFGTIDPVDDENVDGTAI
jgi:hypothetical protein